MFGRLQPAFRAIQAPRLFRSTYQQTQIAGFAQAFGKKKNADNNKFNGKAVVQDAVDSIRMNEQLRYPSMRVVYPNVETGEMEWKILNRADALKMAQDRSLDLILGMSPLSFVGCCICCGCGYLLESSERSRLTDDSFNPYHLK